MYKCYVYKSGRKNIMDKKLKVLFEYQKFTKEPTLEDTIKTVEPDFCLELSDEALFAVAGGVKQNTNSDDKENGKSQ